MSEDEAADEGIVSLTSISEGAGLFLVGKGVSRGLGLVTNVVLTRFLGTNLYGIYAYLTVLLSLFSVFTLLGGDKSVMRFFPEYEERPRKRQAMLTLAYGTSLLMSLLVGGAIYLFAPLISKYTLADPLFVDVLRIAVIVLPFRMLARITLTIFRAIEQLEYNIAISSGVLPVLRLIFVGGAVVLGSSVVGATAGLVVSSVLVLLISLGVLLRKTDLGSLALPTRADAYQYYDFSVPLTFTHLGGFLYNRIDILMVGVLLSESTVAIYNVSVMVAGVLMLPLMAFNQLFPPIASRLYHNDDHAELEATYGTVTKLIFTVSLFPGIAAVLYAQDILVVFGEEFAQGGVVLTLFVFAQLTNCLVGPSGYLLMMSDHQYLTSFNQISSGVLNAVLNYLLITEFGFIGAAVATASTLAGVNLLRVAEVWYLEGYSPYDWSYLKPVTAGIFSGVVMYGLSFGLDRYVLLVFGGLCGGLAYLTTLYLLGIEEREAALLTRLLDRQSK